MAINQLTAGAITAASQVPFFDPTQGQDRRASVTDLATLLQASISPAGGYVTQYAAPAATGFNIAVSQPTVGASIHLLLTPAAGYAAGTITLPLETTCIHGQELLVNSTAAVTTLTLAGNGASVVGGPTTLAANAFFRLRFDAVLSNWYRVG